MTDEDVGSGALFGDWDSSQTIWDDACFTPPSLSGSNYRRPSDSEVGPFLSSRMQGSITEGDTECSSFVTNLFIERGVN